jgi:uncharacterized membrane protein YjfL (UPF0719 family)
MSWNALFDHLVAAVLFGVVGIAMFLGALGLLRRLAPFSVDKELAEDQNIAIAIVMGSMLIGLAIILASAITG